MSNNNILQRDLKSIIKKTSKSDVILQIDELYSSHVSVVLPLSQIVENSGMSKVPINSKTISVISDTIKDNYVISPIVVKRKGNKFELINGRRRYYALKTLGVLTCSAIIVDVNDSDACVMQLIHILDQTSKNVVEAATLCKMLKDKYHYKIKEIAFLTAQSISQVSNLIRILILPEDILNLLANEKLSYGHTKALVSIDKKYVGYVSNKILKEGLSVRKVERICRELNASKKIVDDKVKIKLKFNNVDIDIKNKSISLKFKTKKEMNKFIDTIKK